MREPLAEGLEAGSPAAARAALAWLTDGAQRCLSQEMDALVTAPLNKEAIMRSGQPFIGQTEFLSELAGTSRTAMMLLGQDDRGRWLRVALATTHLPIKLLAAQMRGEKIELAIELAAAGLPRFGPVAPPHRRLRPQSSRRRRRGIWRRRNHDHQPGGRSRAQKGH